MSAMRAKTKSNRYIVRVDVATSPVHPSTRPRSRLSMASSDGSVIHQIQDIESQFQFELGRSFFDRAVQKAQQTYRSHSASTFRSSVPSISSQLSSAHTYGHRYKLPALTKSYKCTSKTPVPFSGFMEQPVDENGVARFEEYIVNGCLDPTAVERRKALERELAEEKELLESQAKLASEELLFDDEFASELMSELNIEQVDFMDGNFVDAITSEQIENGVDGVKGENQADAQLANPDQSEESKLTVEQKESDKVDESTTPDGKLQPPCDNENVLENKQSETEVLKSDEKKTDSGSIEQTTLNTTQNDKVEDNKSQDTTQNREGGITQGESPELETASVGKRSTKSSKSKSGKKAKNTDRKVTFNEEPDVKKMTPRPAKSPKGKKGRVSPTGKKGKSKGSAKGKKKGGKNKSPTPPPEPSETESQKEPEEKPPGEGDGVKGTETEENKEVIPEEPKEPEKIILDEPPQYCLASEYKSKEQMVREWLHSCNSNAAIRTHPIL